MSILVVLAGLFSCESDSNNPIPPTPPSHDWSTQQSFTLENLNDVHFVGNSFGWVVGKELVLSTADGGITWSRAPIESSAPPDLINSIFFVSEQKGWMAGAVEDDQSGSVFISEQGGAYPALQESYHDPLYAVFFFDEQAGWVTGGNGRIAATTDGGSTWDTINELGMNLYDIHFTTAQKGWTVGDNGSLYKTSDGINFNRQELGTERNLNALHFTDTTNGWACGERNTIFRRHLDGGNQVVWSDASATNASEAVEWKDIHFINSSTGWVIGDEGNIFKTTNGGQDWERESIDTFDNLNAIFMASTTRGWIVGDNGAIFTYTPGI